MGCLQCLLHTALMCAQLHEGVVWKLMSVWLVFVLVSMKVIDRKVT